MSVATRPLTPRERERLVAEAAAPPSRGLLALAGSWVMLCLPALGALAGVNLGAALGVAPGPAALAGAVTVLAANALWVPVAWRSQRRMTAWVGESVAHQLANAQQETWRFDPVRAWPIECPVTRALLFELADGRLVAVASRTLETWPAGTFPEHVELEAIPALDRVVALSLSGAARPVQPASVTCEDVAIDNLPIKKRRFVEVSREHLSEATRQQLGLGAVTPGDEAPEVPPVHALLRGTTIDERWKRYRQLVPRRVEFAARAATWSVPVLVVALALAGPLLPAVHSFLRVEGVKPSLAPIALVAWVATAVLGDGRRRRSVARLLAGDESAVPPAWLAAGPVALRRGRVVSPETALLRRRLVLFLGGDVLAGDDFRLATPEGEVCVSVAHAWLVHGERDAWQRLGAAEIHRLAASVLSAPPETGRRWYFRPVQRVGAGDAVHVLGFATADGRRLYGTAEWPVLVWFEGTRVDEVAR